MKKKGQSDGLPADDSGYYRHHSDIWAIRVQVNNLIPAYIRGAQMGWMIVSQLAKGPASIEIVDGD